MKRLIADNVSFWFGLNATSFEVLADSRDKLCLLLALFPRRYEERRLRCQCLFLVADSDLQHYFTSSIEPPWVASILDKGFVWVAVQPTFARLRGCDHRVSTGVRVFAGVLIRRAVAAQRDSTCLARP